MVPLLIFFKSHIWTDDADHKFSAHSHYQSSAFSVFMLPACILYICCFSVCLFFCFFYLPVSLFWRTALENVCYTTLYQRPLLQMYECNVKTHTIMEYVNLNRDEKNGRYVNINFFIVQNIYFVFFVLFFI